MPFISSPSTYFKKRDRLGREPPVWSEESHTAVGGFFSFVIPFGFAIYCMYCVNAYWSAEHFLSSASVLVYQREPLDTRFNLPTLRCIASTGCHVSPMVEPSVSRTILTKSCFSGLPTIIEQRGGRPPPTTVLEMNDTSNANNTFVLIDTQETEPPVTDAEEAGESGRQCFHVACGEDLLPEHLALYYDFDGFNSFMATWSNDTYGFAYEFPIMDESTGDITYEFLKLTQGAATLDVVHKRHLYYGSETIQFLPVQMPIDHNAYSSELGNACCQQRSADFNSEFVSTSTGAVNCSSPEQFQLSIRPSPTYTEQRISAQFVWGQVIGLIGGALGLLWGSSWAITHFWKHLKMRKHMFEERRLDPGNRKDPNIKPESDIVDTGAPEQNSLRFFIPEVRENNDDK